MSTAVKIFIVLNLVMCLAFAYVNMTAYAYRENYKRRWNEDTAKALEEAKANATLAVNRGVEAAKAQNDVRVRDTLIIDLQAKVAELTSQVKDRDLQIIAINESLQRKDADYLALNENFMTQSASLEKVRTRMTELNHIGQVARGTAFNLSIKLAEIEDELNNEVNKNTQQAERIDLLEKDQKKSQGYIAYVRDNHPQVHEAAISEKSGAVAVNAVVALVKADASTGKQEVVVLSVGQAQVEPGTVLIVFRGSDYICRVRVASVTRDHATCRIVPDSWNSKDLKIAVGDSAMTRL